jgi:hypothetical protein
MEKQDQTVMRTENYNSYSTADVLQIRLNSDYVLKRIKIYLSGYIETGFHNPKTGEYEIKTEKLTDPKANAIGQQEILNLVENIVNPVTVQGNFKEKHYYQYIKEAHLALAYDLMKNLYKWGIDEDDYEPIINKIMLLIQPFMSRLIDNKERESYAAGRNVFEGNKTESIRGKGFIK